MNPKTQRTCHNHSENSFLFAILSGGQETGLSTAKPGRTGLVLPGACPRVSATETCLSPVPRYADSRHPGIPADTATAVSEPLVRLPHSELRTNLEAPAPRTADRWHSTSYVAPSHLRLHNPGPDRGIPGHRQNSRSRSSDTLRKNLPLDPSSVPSPPDLFHLHLA
jgi:hypothetical protein